MLDSATVVLWGEAYRTAWEHADSDAVASLFTDDATYRSDIYEEPHIGRGGILEYWRDVTSSQSDVTVLMGTPLVQGSRANIEFWTTMRVGGDEVTLAGCLILDFNAAGKCTALREYWNFAPGAHQPQSGWGAGVSRHG